MQRKYILSPSVVRSQLSNVDVSGFFSACWMICRRPTRPYWSVIVDDGRPFVLVVIVVFDTCCGFVVVVVDDDDDDVLLLLTDAWCRLINVLKASIDVLNDIGDCDWECCCCWDELYPLVIGWWWFDDNDVDEYWLW